PAFSWPAQLTTSIRAHGRVALGCQRFRKDFMSTMFSELCIETLVVQWCVCVCLCVCVCVCVCQIGVSSWAGARREREGGGLVAGDQRDMWIWERGAGRGA